MGRQRRRSDPRFGIGEWFGHSLVLLSDSDRKALNLRRRTKHDRPGCPFRMSQGQPTACNKSSGVCSLRLYHRDADTGKTAVVSGAPGMLRTTCPSRFLEDDIVFKWVGDELLGCREPLLLSEIPYLDPVPTEADVIFPDATASAEENARGTEGDTKASYSRGVGSLDYVLVHPDRPSSWCALELQAVYFSGDEMGKDFSAIDSSASDGTPFPAGRRRPDYRSSGPKRLMPQLQVKVPSLRRWGKKLAVVVDKWFWASLGRMKKVEHVSNCDIAWFLVEYDESTGNPRLTPYRVFYTTLEDAIEGLTAGKPVSLLIFEERLRAKTAEQRQRGSMDQASSKTVQ